MRNRSARTFICQTFSIAGFLASGASSEVGSVSVVELSTFFGSVILSSMTTTKKYNVSHKSTDNKLPYIYIAYFS